MAKGIVDETRLAILAAIVLASAWLAEAAGKTCDVRDYGAKADGATLGTAAIQRAIDACSGAGGGTVLAEGGVFLTGTLILKDNVTLHVSRGATLLGSRDRAQYPALKGQRACFRCAEPYSLLFAENARNIAIEGGGTVDGNDGGSGNPWSAGSGSRPRLLRFMGCDSVSIRNVSFVRSACWTTFLSGCRYVTIDSLRVRSFTGQSNQDGIDIDDCKHFRMTRSRFTTGDDAICFKSMKYGDANEDILIEDCVVDSTRWSAIKLGTETHGGMRDAVIRNCTVNQTSSGALCLFSVDGAVVENVLFENIVIQESATPISLRLGSRMRNYDGGPADPKPGSMRNVTFRNITATGTTKTVGSFISGTPGLPIDGVTLEGLDFRFRGGVTAADAYKDVPPEMETAYPQYDMFDQNMPAYGLYVRHARNVTMRDVKFTFAENDSRPGILLEKDVSGFQLAAPVSVQRGDLTRPGAIWQRDIGEKTVSIRALPPMGPDRNRDVRDGLGRLFPSRRQPAARGAPLAAFAR